MCNNGKTQVMRCIVSHKSTLETDFFIMPGYASGLDHSNALLHNRGAL